MAATLFGHPQLASTRRAPAPSARARALHAHAAFLHALLDEVERLTLLASVEQGFSGQVVEELARLGCRSLEAAVDLSRAGEPDPDPS